MPGAWWRTRLLLLTGSVQLTGLLLSRTIELTGLLLSGTFGTLGSGGLTGLSGQTIWPPLAGLQLPDRPVRIDEAGIGAAEFALLEHDLPADILRRVKLTHKALVAQHRRLRNHQRHRGEAHAARCPAGW